jgi:rod shape-determining protein MreD
MMRYVNHVFWFLGLIALQVFVLDHVHFLGFFLPVLYIYALLRWPADMSTSLVLIFGFFMGLSMDVFSNTPGLHASATTLIAFLRYPTLRLFVSKEDLGNKDVSQDSLGIAAFWKYAVLLVVIHHTTLFLLESFSFVQGWLLLVKIPACCILTLLFIFAFERMNQKKNAKS